MDCIWNGGSHLQAGVEMNPWGYPDFGSFWAAKMTPFWDPNFTPPCGQLAALYLCAHEDPGLNFKSCTPM